jgi:hypothetical protein
VPRARPVLLFAACIVVTACSKASPAPERGDDPAGAKANGRADCGHTLCGSNFFVDASPAGDCTAGASCALAIKLVATGDFHINDEYPYKLTADDAPGVEYLGAGAGGRNVFSKASSDWQKRDEKSGVMTLAFRSASRGDKILGGTFKLSVCSAQNCQLEQEHVQATVAVR